MGIFAHSLCAESEGIVTGSVCEPKKDLFVCVAPGGSWMLSAISSQR